MKWFFKKCFSRFPKLQFILFCLTIHRAFSYYVDLHTGWNLWNWIHLKIICSKTRVSWYLHFWEIHYSINYCNLKCAKVGKSDHPNHMLCYGSIYYCSIKKKHFIIGPSYYWFTIIWCAVYESHLSKPILWSSVNQGNL